jgi:hypothetical protein
LVLVHPQGIVDAQFFAGARLSIVGGANPEASGVTMTDAEQPKASAWMKAFKRIFAVLAVCWAVFCLIVVAAILYRRQGQLRSGDVTAVGIFLAGAVIVPALGYAFFFKLVPWIIEGFRKK